MDKMSANINPRIRRCNCKNPGTMDSPSDNTEGESEVLEEGPSQYTQFSGSPDLKLPSKGLSVRFTPDNASTNSHDHMQSPKLVGLNTDTMGRSSESSCRPTCPYTIPATEQIHGCQDHVGAHEQRAYSERLTQSPERETSTKCAENSPCARIIEQSHDLRYKLTQDHDGSNDKSTVSLERTSQSFETSSSFPDLECYECSAFSSSSSCNEDPSTFFRMDAMDDSSGTSSDEAESPDVTDVSGNRNSAASCPPSPRPVFAIPLPVSNYRVLATSTPRKVFYPQYTSSPTTRSDFSSLMSPEDLHKIKCLAASMPTTPEEQRKIMPILRSEPLLGKDDLLIIPRSQVCTSVSPKTWPSPVRRMSPKPALSLDHRGEDSDVGDLSPHIVRDIGLRPFTFPCLGKSPSSVSGQMFTPEQHAVTNQRGITERRTPRPRRRLDKLFQNSCDDKNVLSPRDFSKVNHDETSSCTRLKPRRFPNETEEAVYYLRKKYLNDSVC